MTIQFFKYQGTGNDFVILDNRDGLYNNLTEEQIRLLCHRRMGVGADGLMLLNTKEGYDFEMKYYNSDGREGTMCGNGGRCLVKFAYNRGIHRTEYRFSAVDGDHLAEVDADGTVSLKMRDVNPSDIQSRKGDWVIFTGSPHYIRPVNDIKELNVYKEGRNIRYNDEFAEKGINVNFVEIIEDGEIFVRTYERGVEDETYSCGTGVTAAAIAYYHNEVGFNNVVVHTKGGELNVEFERNAENEYRNIWLSGPAEEVFKGEINI
jgi:diaminopimelate epimerase